MTTRLAALTLLLLTFGYASIAQQMQEEATKIPTATQWTLDAAGPVQRAAIGSVFLMHCPNAMSKGTGFLLKSGLIVTNAHVVAGCDAQQMVAVSSRGSVIHFSKMVTDGVKDLALLRPTEPLKGGLELGPEQDPQVGTSVSTWGYPLTYNGPPPLLSVGYVAGFTNEREQPGSQPVKHLIVNGAFNPGNSGGPLFLSKDNKVIGVVVAKFHLYPPIVKEAITALSNNKSGLMYGGTDEHGAQVQFSEGQIVGMVLEQFYKTTQVMIGEAISLSELSAFIASKEAELR
jgi:S1-C subfamily serine protease